MRNIAATLALLLAMTQAHGAPQQGEDHASGAAMIITYFTVCPTAKFYDMDNATRGVLELTRARNVRGAHIVSVYEESSCRSPQSAHSVRQVLTAYSL